MDSKYKEWIDIFVEKHKGNVTNLCFIAVEEMSKAFPELIKERGWVYFEKPRNFEIFDQHHWLMTKTGEIIDPTVKQYDGYKIVKYQPYDEELHGPEPTGKCYECGEYVYGGGNFCSYICEKRAIESLNKIGRI